MEPGWNVVSDIVCTPKFSLATSEHFKDKSDTFQDRTEWHNIVVWQKLAEIVGEFESKARTYVLRETPNYKLGRSADRRQEIPDRDGGQRSGAPGLAREGKWSAASWFR